MATNKSGEKDKSRPALPRLTSENLKNYRIANRLTQTAEQYDSKKHRPGRILSVRGAGKLIGRFGFDRYGLDGDQKAWMVMIFFAMMGEMSRGGSTRAGALYANFAQDPGDMRQIDHALDRMELLGLIETERNTHNGDPTERGYHLDRFAVNTIMDGQELPLMEDLELICRRTLLALMPYKERGETWVPQKAREACIAVLEDFSDNPFVRTLRCAEGLSETEACTVLFAGAIELIHKQGVWITDLSILIDKPIAKDFLLELELRESLLIKDDWLECLFDEDTMESRLFLSAAGRTRLGLPPVYSPGESGKNGRNHRSGEPGQKLYRTLPNTEILPEELYFNERISAELTFYGKLLALDDSLLSASLPGSRRIMLMFEGLPGTGKTAAARQLARQSGRDLLHVEWQAFRDKYVGQSERNLKSLLSELEAKSGRGERAPVVLINEAEAFLSQRMPATQASERMENNLVGMLLEWMEKEDPFMAVVFTSNHPKIMDIAFERRITHLRFDLPDRDTRCRIWEALDRRFGFGLPQSWHASLSAHELSGAEIAGALRAYRLRQLAGDEQQQDLQLLHRICGEQRWMESKGSIGFRGNAGSDLQACG